jgi:hypothetical protein
MSTVKSYLPKARFQPPFFFLTPRASVESLPPTSLSSSSAPDSAPCSSHESLGVAPAGPEIQTRPVFFQKSAGIPIWDFTLRRSRVAYPQF